MDVLTYLVAHRGEVVPAHELLEAVWRGEQNSYNAVYKSIAELRRVFGDAPQASRYIQTVAKRGYRLVAEVKETNDGASDPQLHRTQASTIAVLQFININGDPRNEPLVRGLAEALIGRLIEIPHVEVTSMPLGARDELAAEHFLEGSVQRDGDRFRIIARLTRPGDRIHLLSRGFDVTAGDVFSLQDEVADQIVKSVSDVLGL